MKKIKELSETEIVKYDSNYSIPENDAYELDSNYVDFLFSLDSIKYENKQKNHFQPLQALYYDNSGQLVSFHVNCDAGGFPNLKWNRFGAFDTFLLKHQAPVDSILSLRKHLDFLTPIHQSTSTDWSAFDDVVIVHWIRFMGRQGKRLIEIVQKNVGLDTHLNSRVIYVNNDNIFNRVK